jgi:hypothetical protein
MISRTVNPCEPSAFFNRYARARARVTSGIEYGFTRVHRVVFAGRPHRMMQSACIPDSAPDPVRTGCPEFDRQVDGAQRRATGPGGRRQRGQGTGALAPAASTATACLRRALAARFGSADRLSLPTRASASALAAARPRNALQQILSSILRIDLKARAERARRFDVFGISESLLSIQTAN